LRLVAKHASGWNTVWRWSPEAYADRVRELERICEAVDRDPGSVRRSVGLYALVGKEERDLRARFDALRRWTPGGALDDTSLEAFAEDTLTGTPEDCLKRLSRFAELGVEEVIIGAASVPFAVFDWSMVELISEAVVPEAQRL
jgi:alkanesulfonate monooxygenase SsuD/methylene tetrahydromethanopterin reductase-like flavin-dependent oxidoreductase (luciferase family)